MRSEALVEPIGGAAAEAAARSALYGELSGSLAFPSRTFHAKARSGELRARFETCLRLLPEPVEEAAELLAGLSGPAARYEDFQSEYVGLFDVGPGGPPCPLTGGGWIGDRQRTMEDDLRFYRFFGVTAADTRERLPDHVTTELEFLHLLSFQEAAILADGGDARSLQRAARDFLGRHPARWLPAAAGRLQELGAPRFWTSLVSLAAACCGAHANRLADRDEGSRP